MINIKRGSEEYKVSKESYKIFFKDLGFEIIGEKKPIEKAPVKPEAKKEEPKTSKKVGDK